MGNEITNDELMQFKSLKRQTIIQCMTLYLIGDGKRTYNMEEVGERVFGSKTYSFTVSLIHRCYGFAGQNGGKYKNGCKFEREHGYVVSKKDIEAFVDKFKYGSYKSNVSFENFLITRINMQNLNKRKEKEKKIEKEKAISKQHVNEQIVEDIFSQDFSNEPNKKTNYIQNNNNNILKSSSDFNASELAVLIVPLIALVAMIVSKNFFRHWIIGLLVSGLLVVISESLFLKLEDFVCSLFSIILILMFSSGNFSKYWIVGIILLLCTAKLIYEASMKSRLIISSAVVMFFVVLMFVNGTLFINWIWGTILYCLSFALIMNAEKLE